MKRIAVALLALSASGWMSGQAAEAAAPNAMAEAAPAAREAHGESKRLEIEERVAEAIAADRVTLVHFWAPWCSNCRAELSSHGWRDFIAANPKVEFIFVTIWSDTQGDGRRLLEQFGVGPQKNFQLLLHPNRSRKSADKMTAFLGLPVTWVPTTWVFREGQLRFALNYGEVRFPVLQQLVDDSARGW